jgi:hypothetical protein
VLRRVRRSAKSEEIPMEMTQRRVAATAANTTKPAGVPASVFDMGRQAKPTKKPRERLDFNPDVVEIRTNVPPPPLLSGPRGSKYRQLLDRMKAGESVVVPKRAGYGLKSAAKKADVKLIVRTLEDGQVGVWKL